MINLNYSLFYQFNKTHDCLIVVFHNFAKVTSYKMVGNILVTYQNNEVHSYVFFNFKKIMKIKINGMIYLPNDAFIDLLNSILKNNHLDIMKYKNTSGYIIKKNDKHKVVTAIKDTMLSSGKIVDTEHICSYKDLSISNSEDIFYADETDKIGSDFFMMEDISNVRD